MNVAKYSANYVIFQVVFLASEMNPVEVNLTCSVVFDL